MIMMTMMMATTTMIIVLMVMETMTVHGDVGIGDAGISLC